MHSITLRLDFCYGHRIQHHDGKCKNAHGHNGVVEVYIFSRELDHLSMVLDFGHVKKLVKEWVDEHWDHKMVLAISDPLLDVMIGNGQPVYSMSGKPTAENMAKELYGVLDRLLASEQVTLGKVTIWETPNSCASYSE